MNWAHNLTALLLIHMNHSNSILFILLFFMITISAHSEEKIPFSLMPSGHILVKAKINGVEGNFIFDTGAGFTLLTRKFATHVQGLENTYHIFTLFRDTGEKITTNLYKANSLSIGSYTQADPFIAIEDVNLGSADGLISLKTFENQAFTIDYTNKMLILETATSLPKRIAGAKIIPIQLEKSREIAVDVFTYVNVKGVRLQVLLDSGAGENVFHLNAAYMKMLNFNPSDTSKIKISESKSDFNKQYTVKIYKTQLPEIRLSSGTVQIIHQNPTVSFIDGLIYDGKISINWLGEQLTFDISKERIFVK